MNLINKTKAERIAEAVDAKQFSQLNILESSLRQMWDEVNTDGEQQAILDAWGGSASTALNNFSVMRAAVFSINPASELPEPDLSVFVPNEDGTVTYVAPPEPEVEPEP